MATRILIADDSAIVRQCLGRLLCGHTDWEVCGEATDGEDAICKTQELDPDLVVLDFLMPRRRFGARGRRRWHTPQGRTEQGGYVC